MSVLEIRGLSKSFGGLQAVKDLSFDVGDGEIVALIGPNGAGKTTVFALVSGFLDPDAGEIAFRGRSVRGLKPHALARAIRIGARHVAAGARHFAQVVVAGAGVGPGPEAAAHLLRERAHQAVGGPPVQSRPVEDHRPRRDRPGTPGTQPARPGDPAMGLQPARRQWRLRSGSCWTPGTTCT